MHSLTAKRTLVKSPPELWSELSEVERLARHLGAFGEIKITKLEPEHTVAWEGEAACGTVLIEPSGWGTKVTLEAQVEAASPSRSRNPSQSRSRPRSRATSSPGRARTRARTGFFARLFAWGPREAPVAASEPEPQSPSPEPAPEAEPEPGPGRGPGGARGSSRGPGVGAPPAFLARLAPPAIASGALDSRRAPTDNPSMAVSRRRFLEAPPAWRSSGVLSELGQFAQRPDQPNVLVVIVDSLRADAVYDNWVRTPNIEALARQGLRFTNAYPEAMPTVPARNSIMSGRRAVSLPRLARLPRAHPGDQAGSPCATSTRALPAVLRRAGYWTAYVTDNPFLGFSRPYGPLRRSVNRFVRTVGRSAGSSRCRACPKRILNHWLHPASYDAKTRQRVGYYLANSRFWEDPRKTYAARVFRDAMRVLDEAAEQRPFALFVDTYEPHEPWTPAAEVPEGCTATPTGAGPSRECCATGGRATGWAPASAPPCCGRIRDLYSAEVTMTDLWLGRLLDRLHGKDLERETVILLVSDHGVLLGEHGWTGKVQVALYPALINVPFIVVDPRRRHAGRKSDFFASTHDVAPTVLSMADVPVPEAMTGVDLSRPFEAAACPTATTPGAAMPTPSTSATSAGRCGPTTGRADSSCSTSGRPRSEQQRGLPPPGRGATTSTARCWPARAAGCLGTEASERTELRALIPATA